MQAFHTSLFIMITASFLLYQWFAHRRDKLVKHGIVGQCTNLQHMPTEHKPQTNQASPAATNFKTYLNTLYHPPLQVLGLPATANVSSITRRFMKLFQERTHIPPGQEVQVLCSAFLMLITHASHKKTLQNHAEKCQRLSAHLDSLQMHNWAQMAQLCSSCNVHTLVTVRLC